MPSWFGNSCLKIFKKINVLKNFAKFTEKHLCLSHFLMKLQVSYPETALKRDPIIYIYLRIWANFQKNLFTEHLRMTAPADSSVPTKILSIDHTFFVFPSFFSFVIDNCNYGSLFRKVIKMKIFLLFAIIYTKNSMNIVKTVSPRQ